MGQERLQLTYKRYLMNVKSKSFVIRKLFQTIPIISETILKAISQ